MCGPMITGCYISHHPKGVLRTLYRSGKRQTTCTTESRNMRFRRKVIEYIWQEGRYTGYCSVGCACRLYFGVCIEQRSMGRGGRVFPLPSKCFCPPPAPDRLDKETTSIRNAASLIIGRRIFKRACLAKPHRRLFTQKQQKKKRHYFLFPTPHFSVVVLTFGFPCALALRNIRLVTSEKTRGFETQTQKKS